MKAYNYSSSVDPHPHHEGATTLQCVLNKFKYHYLKNNHLLKLVAVLLKDKALRFLLSLTRTSLSVPNRMSRQKIYYEGSGALTFIISYAKHNFIKSSVFMRLL